VAVPVLLIAPDQGLCLFRRRPFPAQIFFFKFKPFALETMETRQLPKLSTSSLREKAIGVVIWQQFHTLPHTPFPINSKINNEWFIAKLLKESMEFKKMANRLISLKKNVFLPI
jgi:hypothetical protein